MKVCFIAYHGCQRFVTIGGRRTCRRRRMSIRLDHAVVAPASRIVGMSILLLCFFVAIVRFFRVLQFLMRIRMSDTF